MSTRGRDGPLAAVEGEGRRRDGHAGVALGHRDEELDRAAARADPHDLEGIHAGRGGHAGRPDSGRGRRQGDRRGRPEHARPDPPDSTIPALAARTAHRGASPTDRAPQGEIPIAGDRSPPTVHTIAICPTDPALQSPSAGQPTAWLDAGQGETMKRRLQFLSLAALALGAVVVAAPTASAQDAGTAELVIVHGLRGFTADLYVDGKLLINTFRPERSTDPMAVPAGSHLVEIREAGTGADTTPAVDRDHRPGRRQPLRRGGPRRSGRRTDGQPVPRRRLATASRAGPSGRPQHRGDRTIDVRFGPTVAAAALANGAGSTTLLPAGVYSSPSPRPARPRRSPRPATSPIRRAPRRSCT